MDTMIWICAFFLLFALAAAAFYNGLAVRRYEVSSDKLPSGSRIRIVLIADLHSTLYGKDQHRLISKIKEQQPDIIALAGDIIDDEEDEDAALSFLEGIRGIAPVYYVTGNHEIWSGEHRRLKDMVASCGHTVLSGETQCITVNGSSLCISGIDDFEILKHPNKKQKLSTQSCAELFCGFAGLDKAKFNILLVHRPEKFYLYQQYDFDLVLCGHAHGGQVRIPGILNGLFAPGQGLFPKYAGGLYKENDQSMIVSRGLSLKTKLPRVFNPPEIVVAEICGSGTE